MRRFALITTFVVLVSSMAIDTRADVPTSMNVQGRLTDAAGAPVAQGFKSFTFKIYDSPVGGTEIWPGETQFIATDAAGLWDANVGAVTPLAISVFSDAVRWLEVTVDDGINPTETLPRVQLVTSPYAY